MKLLLFLTASLWLLSCKKDSKEPAQKLSRREEITDNGTLIITQYEYDAQGRIVAIKTGQNNDPVQPNITVTYSGNEAILHFLPYVEGAVTTARQLHLILDAGGKLLRRVLSSQTVDALHPANFQSASDTMDCAYDAAGFLVTVSGRRSDSSWYQPATSITSRRTFTTLYTTVDGKLTHTDQTGLVSRMVSDNSAVTSITKTLDYHGIFSYTKQYPNKFDCRNAAILNQTSGYGGSDMYFTVNVFEPLVDAQYLYMPERTQLQALEKENGNVVVGFNSDVEVARTYNQDGMLATTEIITPNHGLQKISYFYSR